MDKPTCETCRFFELTDLYAYDGECHRYPPSIKDDLYYRLPGVDKDFWCGEHQLTIQQQSPRLLPKN